VRSRNGRWIYGAWKLGSNYARHDDARRINYHGAYMAELLRRFSALFFAPGRILHVCSGALRPDNRWLPGDTIDCNPEVCPTFCVDAQTCAGVDLGVYDTVFADVPYTDKDDAIYQARLLAVDPARAYPALIPKRVMKTLIHGLRPGARIVWLDEIEPQHDRAWPIQQEAMAYPARSRMGCNHQRRAPHSHCVRL
jgi:hypothetical protein